MRADHMRRILVPSLILLVLAAAFLLGSALLPDVGTAAGNARRTAEAVQVQSGNVIVEFGESVLVRRNQRVETVLVFGGNATIAGTVTNAVVVFGGNVHILPTAVVGSAVSPDDASIVSMGGTIRIDEGAEVTGAQVDRANWTNFADLDIPSAGWWGGLSFFGWLVQTAVFLVLGLVAAALLPRQMQAVGRTVGRRTGASLGWGALTFFIIVPVAAVVLLISIIGILVLIPAIVVVPLFYFFASISVAAYIVQKLLKGTDNLMVTTSIGIVATSIIAQIPVAGGLAVLALILFGTGAAVLTLLERRRERRMLPAPAGGPPAGPGYPEAPPYGPVPPYGPAAPAPYEGTPPVVAPPVPGSVAADTEPAPEQPLAPPPAPGTVAEAPPDGEQTAAPAEPTAASAEPTAVTWVAEEPTQLGPAEPATQVVPAPEAPTAVTPPEAPSGVRQLEEEPTVARPVEPETAADEDGERHGDEDRS